MSDREAAAARAPLPPLPQSVFGVNPAPNASAVAAPTYMVAAYTADQMREYVLADRRAAVSSAPAPDAIPAELFDGYSVYSALTGAQKAFVSPEAVSAVLDAAVRVIRASRALEELEGKK